MSILRTSLLLPLCILAYTSFQLNVEAADCARAFQEEFANCRLLSPELALHWRVEEGITFALDLDGSWNWLGLGVSEAGGMLAADIAIAQRDPSNEALWSIGDYWSTEFEEPVLDTNTQDAVLVSTNQSANATRVVFWRPLDTCDNKEDSRIIHGVTHYVIYAYGQRFGYHGPLHRGTVQIELAPLLQAALSPPPALSLQPAPLPAPRRRAAATAAASAADAGGDVGAGATSPPGQAVPGFSPVVLPGPGPDSAVWELRMDRVAIPAEDTTYYCRHFQLPNPSTKVHVTGFEVVLDNPRFVHHMIIYACMRPPAAPTQLYECVSMDSACQAFYILWAPGGLGGAAPPEAGYAFGGDSGITWVSLQVHYTNLELAPGLLDSSGFRLRATTTLRRYDMGVLTLGSVDFAIPPGKTEFSSDANLCPSACTKRLPGPITLVASGFHMHTLGRRMKTQWLRGAQELPPVGERKAYAFDFQGASPVDPANRTLLPGDELVTTCTWDSSSRADWTYYGESTTDEMCYNFLFYYPRVTGIEVCATLSSQPRLGICATMDRANDLLNQDDENKAWALGSSMVASGELIVNPRAAAYRPYNRTCARTPAPNSRGPNTTAASPPRQPMTTAQPPPTPTPQGDGGGGGGGKPPPKRGAPRPPPPRRRSPRRPPPKRAGPWRG